MLTLTDLRSTRRVLEIHQDLVAQGEIPEDCPPETVIALAELSLRRGRSPASLFEWFLRNEHAWDSITDADLKTAKTRVERLRRRRMRIETKNRPENYDSFFRLRAATRNIFDVAPPLPTYSEQELEMLNTPVDTGQARRRHLVITALQLAAAVVAVVLLAAW